MPVDSLSDLPFTQVLISNSPDETIQIGKRIALKLYNGAVLALDGCLGSGKTCLTKGIAAGLGITDIITSPTYTIISEYLIPGKEIDIVTQDQTREQSLYHIDAYRLADERDFENIGGMEIFDSGGVCVIEWSERIAKCLPDDVITVSLEITGAASRNITINGIKL